MPGPEMENHVKVPDFSEADYKDIKINLKDVIYSIITDLKFKFPDSSIYDLRIKLLSALQTLTNKYQQQHVTTLRMKEEFLSGGNVPATVDKYLDELRKTIKELSCHCEIISEMVTQESKRRQEEEAKAQMIMKKELVVNHLEHDSLSQNETEEKRKVIQDENEFKVTQDENKLKDTQDENKLKDIQDENKDVQDENERIVNLNDQMDKLVKVPDFSKADYDGTIINLKHVINSIISDLQFKFPGSSVYLTRIKLLASLQTLRGKYQQQHVTTLCMKEKFLSEGNVSATVDKYLDELSGAVKELTNHCDIIAKMVAEEARMQAEKENAIFKANQIRVASHAANQRAAADVSTAGIPGMRNAHPQNASNPHPVQRQLADLPVKNEMCSEDKHDTNSPCASLH